MFVNAHSAVPRLRIGVVPTAQCVEMPWFGNRTLAASSQDRYALWAVQYTCIMTGNKFIVIFSSVTGNASFCFLEGVCRRRRRLFPLDSQVPVGSWFDDMADTELRDLVPFFERLSRVEDVYTVLRNANPLAVVSGGGGLSSSPFPAPQEGVASTTVQEL